MRNVPLPAAVSVEIDGQSFVDDGPEGDRPSPAPATRPADVVANVRLKLVAPRGEVCGALLDDGTIVCLHPKLIAESEDAAESPADQQR